MSVHLESLKSFFYKQSYDFQRTDISLYNFHPQLCILLAINGIFFNKKQSLFRFVCPFIGAFFGVIFSAWEYITTAHNIYVMDYSLATECFCYGVLMGATLMVIVSMIINARHFHKLVERMNDDFQLICKREYRYRQKFLKGQLLIWQLFVGWFLVFSLPVSCLHALMPIVNLSYQSVFVIQDEHTMRPLQFPLWLPHDDVYKTPIYELLLVLEVCCVIIFLLTFIVFIYTFFHILLHYYTIMDVIILEFDVIFDGLEENVALLQRHDPRRMEVQKILNKRIGNIVKMHISVLDAVKNVSSVYSIPLVYQMLLSSIVICLIAFQIAEKLKNGVLPILFILLGLGALIQLWIPCCLGSIIENKAYAVGDACWNCGWHQTSLGRLIRPDIIIIILRTQRPLTIKFTGLRNLKLQTYSVLISKAYSYFNMLRQYS